jgi:peroxiredoxin
MVISAYNLSKSENKAWSSIKDVIDRAEKENYKVVGLSASGNEAIEKLKDEYGFDIPFYFTDETAIKTIVRSNPGILVIEDAVILQKLHWNDAEETQF